MSRLSLSIFVLAVFSARILTAESSGSHPAVVDIYSLRSAEQLQSPHVVTYRVAEWEQIRGRWILPDLGYYDTGYGKDQIWLIGAGEEVVHRKHIDWAQEVYFAQEAGPESQNKRSLWLWPVVDLRFSRRLSGEIAAYPTIPLDRAQRWSYSVDRAKLERAVGNHWLAGVGYSGGICSTRTWQNLPFLTVTRQTGMGNFEFWLQRNTSGAQLQLRYSLVRNEK